MSSESTMINKLAKSLAQESQERTISIGEIGKMLHMFPKSEMDLRADMEILDIVGDPDGENAYLLQLLIFQFAKLLTCVDYAKALHESKTAHSEAMRKALQVAQTAIDRIAKLIPGVKGPVLPFIHPTLDYLKKEITLLAAFYTSPESIQESKRV